MAAGADGGEPTADGYTPFFYSGRDGLRLYGRDYPGAGAKRLPVVCLPGLTRNSRDFHELALRLSSGPAGRRVVAFDFRGRGRSDYDPSGASYLPGIEAQDVLDGLADRGIARAGFVGTSRGGIVTMLLGGMAPERIGAAVLNDIGSVIDTAGLVHIRSYVGAPLPDIDWDEEARRLAATSAEEFPSSGPEDWQRRARLTFAEKNGRPVLDYDTALAAGFKDVTPQSPPVDLSAAFATLSTVPVLVIRGGCSRLLSAATVAAMRAAHPHLESFEVAGQGHPPDLRGDVASRIADFLDRIDPTPA